MLSNIFDISTLNYDNDIIPKARTARASDLLICAYCCTHRRMLPSALGGLRFRVPPVPGHCAPGVWERSSPASRRFARPSTERENYSKKPSQTVRAHLKMESCTIKRIKKPREQAPGSTRPALPRWPGRRGAGCPSRPSAPPHGPRTGSPCARSPRTAHR